MSSEVVVWVIERDMVIYQCYANSYQAELSVHSISPALPRIHPLALPPANSGESPRRLVAPIDTTVVFLSRPRTITITMPS